MRTLILRETGPDAVYAYGELVHGYRPAAHHKEMVEFALDHIYRRKNAVILAFRGAAKSTWLTKELACFLISRFPDLRVGIMSKSEKAAEAFSRAIRETFESNEVHRSLFGMTQSDRKWTDQEWLHKDSRWTQSNNVTVFAQGVLGQIASKRFDLLLLDDILTEENTGTTDQREKVWTWLQKTVLPCLSADGVCLVAGTRWAEDDVYQRLTTPRDEGGSGWDLLRIKALEENEDGSLRSRWPEEFTVERLLEIRDNMGGPLFSCAFQNDLAGLLKGNIFSGPFEHYDTLPEGHKYSTKMGVDLASSEKERADWTARVTTHEDICAACALKGYYYVESAVRDKRASGHREFVHDGWMAHPNMDLVIVETVQFQSTLVQELMREYPRIPVEGKKTDTDKTARARAVAAKFEAHRIKLHSSLRGSWFETELLSFPKGHDDGIDCLGFSLDMGSGGLIFAIL